MKIRPKAVVVVVAMDSPYDAPWGVVGNDAGGGAGSTTGGGGDPSAGETVTIAVMILVEIVVIAGLLFYLVRTARCLCVASSCALQSRDGWRVAREMHQACSRELAISFACRAVSQCS